MPNPLARRAMAAKTGRSVAAAMASLDRQARQETQILKQELLVAARTFQRKAADEISRRTGLPRVGAKRRLRVFKSKRTQQVYAGVAVSKSASIIHAGRLMGVRQRGGKIISLPPGIEETGIGQPFLLQPKRWRGQKKRIYQSGGRGRRMQPLRHRRDIAEDIFEQMAERLGPRLLREAVARARKRNRRTALMAGSRGKFGFHGEARTGIR